MRDKLKVSFFGVAALICFSAVGQKDPQYGKAAIEELIEAMTPEEKAKLLVGPGMPGYAGLVPLEGEPDVRVLGEAGGNDKISRLGIPETVFADGPAGLRIEPKRKNDPNTYYATAFPVGTALASTWNTDLIESVGEAMGEEVKEYGVDVLLAPALNIHRNPLNGRNFEYYSEDPLVAGKIASAYIQGIQSHNVGTSIKHFAANNQETNRLAVNAHISERAMREIYLRGFEIAIKESKPWTVMTAYNKLNGTYASANMDLLTTILRDEWGYEGLVMTDWFGGYPGFNSILEEGSVSDVVAQINAGNDLLMPGTEAQREVLVKAIEKGTVNEEAVNNSLRRILKYIQKSPTTDEYKFSNTPDLEAHAKVTRKAAAEGMILLKNKDNVLPFTDKSGNIAIFGDHSYSFIAGGTGSGDVNEAYSISLLEGLNNAGYSVDKELQGIYEPFVAQAVKNENERRKEIGLLADNKRLPEMLPDSDFIEAKAKSTDVAVITLGRNSGEQFDRKIDDDFYLGPDEVKLINTVTKAFHSEGKKVIVILNIGGVIETASWKDKVDAILLAWQPGQEGGNSVADIFSGKVNPSGKLTMTFPIDYNHHASAANWLGEPLDKPTDVYYKEDIYIGYRYFDTFEVQPSYEFGFGKSYTSFDYTDLELSSSTFLDEVEVSVKVTNTGDVAGKEVVQVYVSAPTNLVDKPSQELKAFGKTKTLKPGKSEILKFTLKAKDLASFVDKKSAWIAEKGTYMIKVGASSLAIKLEDKLEVPSDIIAEKVNNTFDLDTGMSILKND